MSLIFASVSRRLTGILRCGIALIALFLAGQVSLAQETNGALSPAINQLANVTNSAAATNLPTKLAATPTPALGLSDTNELMAAALAEQDQKAKDSMRREMGLS